MLFISRFSAHFSEEKLRVIFLHQKFGKTPRCLRCQSKYIYRLNKIKYRCRKCWYEFRLLSNTYLSKLRIPLRLWYEIGYCFAIGLPALKAQKVLKLKRYYPVYRGYTLIRQVIVVNSQQEFQKLSGTVELDESFWGGKFKNKRLAEKKELYVKGLVKKGRGAIYLKQPVFGIYQRNGCVFLDLIPDTKKKSIQPIIENKVLKGAIVYSDTWKAYDGLIMQDYIHRRVDNGNNQYVIYEKGEKIHVNGMEGFWGLGKNFMAVYKGIRKNNWKLYLKELEFRYNNRKLDFDQMTLKIIKIMTQNYEESSLVS